MPTFRAITPHSILVERLKQLKEQLYNGCDNEHARQLVNECVDLATPLDDYIASVSSNPSKNLRDLEEKTNRLDWDAALKNLKTKLPLEKEMLSGAVEGQLLALLAAVTNSKKVLEIGSFTGYASLAIAEVLPEDGKLVACEYDNFTANFARQELDKSPAGHKIDIRVGDAMDTLKNLANENCTFDFVFIDADKQNYYNYYNFVLENSLIKKNGLICVDNTLFMGQVYSGTAMTQNGEAIRQFNARLVEDRRVQQVLLPVRDGLTLIRNLG